MGDSVAWESGDRFLSGRQEQNDLDGKVELLQAGINKLNEGSFSASREALEIFEKLEKGFTDDYFVASVLQLQGECFSSLRQYEQALQPFRRALPLAEKLCRIHNIGENHLAEKTLIECHILLAQTQAGMAKALSETGQHHHAVRMCDVVLEESKRWPIFKRLMSCDGASKITEAIIREGLRFLERFPCTCEYVEEVRKIQMLRGSIFDLVHGDCSAALGAYDQAYRFLLMEAGFKECDISTDNRISFHTQVGSTLGNSNMMLECFEELQKGFDVLRRNPANVFSRISENILDQLARRYEMSWDVSGGDQLVYLEKAAFFRRQLYSLRADVKYAQCVVCDKKTENVKFCSQCKVECYCSVACQKAHWKSGHKQMCQVAKSLEDVQARAMKECPFCMEDINLAVPSDPDNLIFTLPCGHIMHKNCAEKDPNFRTLDRQCPVCRHSY